MGKLHVREVFLRLLQLPGNLYDRVRLPKINVGDTYLDCGNHPVICTEVDLIRLSGSQLGPWDYDLASVSLVDLSSPRSCSTRHCAPRKIPSDIALRMAAAIVGHQQVYENLENIASTMPELRRAWS